MARYLIRTSFLLAFSFYILPIMASQDLKDQTDKYLYKARKALFHNQLNELASELGSIPERSPTIFICYSWANEQHGKQVLRLVKDLYHFGVPYEKIYHDISTNRPNLGTNIHKFTDKIFKADTVILVGSPSLKAKYDNPSEEKREIVAQEIDNLRTRKKARGEKGILPVWFEGEPEQCFPESLQPLSARNLREDYFGKFFKLLIDIYSNIYQLIPNSNIIEKHQSYLNKLLNRLPEDILNEYRQRLQQQEKTEEEERIKKIQNVLLGSKKK